jgi:cytoskeletal protein RodZ
MHTHDGTKRLLVKLVSLVIAGLALYFVLFYGVRTAGNSGIATSTSSGATNTVQTALNTEATSSPISSSPGVTNTSSNTISTQIPPTQTSPTPLANQVVITNDDNNSTVTLQKGQEFTVEFGGDLNWTISFDPSSAIIQQRNIATSSGVQGMYVAAESGTVTLKATGAPICKAGEACPMFRVLSTVTLNILQ